MSKTFPAMGLSHVFSRSCATAAEVIRNAHDRQERTHGFSILRAAAKSTARDRNSRRERSAQYQHASGQHK
jgi:hypothetical protein